MSEMPEASSKKADAKSLDQILAPILIGAVAELLIGELKALSPGMRIVSVIFIGLVYGGLTNRIGFKKVRISRGAAILLSILFLLAGILILLASIILNLDAMQTATLLGCLAVMVLSLWVARILPESSSLARSLLTGAATFSLGAAVAIGGAPVVQFAMMEGTTDLLIQNDCDTPMVNTIYDLNVPAHGQQVKKMPAVSFTLERTANELMAEGAGISIASAAGQKLPFNTSIEGCKKITVDGQLLRPGDSIELRLQENRGHVISIGCSACS